MDKSIHHSETIFKSHQLPSFHAVSDDIFVYSIVMTIPSLSKTLIISIFFCTINHFPPPKISSYRH